MRNKAAIRCLARFGAAAAFCPLFAGPAQAGTWTQLPPRNVWGGEQIVLLSDGTVMFQGGSAMASILHPDASGNYVNGTWTSRSPSPYGSWLCPSSTLNDGTWLYYGGEYNPNNPSAAEIYDPATGAWRIGISPISRNVYDSCNATLKNGLVLNNSLAGTEQYNWQTSSWSYVSQALNWGDEANVELLPSGDVFDPLFNEQYNGSTGAWFGIPAPPIVMGNDPGPTIQCYNGQVIVESTTNQIAFYTPSATPGVAGAWSATTITLPSGVSLGDTNSTMEPNGNVLIGGTNVYELDPVTKAVALSASGPGGTFLTLPNGQIIVCDGPHNWIYTPTGGPSSAWRPTVTSVTGTGPFTLTGTQLFGLSQCATDNDDGNAAENYPIVYLKSGSNVWYCRSYNYSTRTIAPGSAAQTCQFSLPAGLAAGTYSLYVSVNGISSATPYSFTTPAAPTLYLSSGQQYKLVPSSTGSYPMNYNGGNPAELVAAVDSNDYWTAIRNANGTYTLRAGTGPILDGNGVTVSGGAVVTKPANGGLNQQWTVTQVAGGYYEIANKTSGLALDGGTGPAANQPIVQTTYTGATGQKWTLLMANPAPVGLVSGHKHILTPSSNGSYAMNSNIGGNPEEYVGDLDSNDYWTATRNTNGTYTLVDSAGTALDGNGVTTSGGAVTTKPVNGGSNQQWTVTAAGGGYYEIANKTSGLALDGGTAGSSLR